MRSALCFLLSLPVCAQITVTAANSWQFCPGTSTSNSRWTFAPQFSCTVPAAAGYYDVTISVTEGKYSQPGQRMMLVGVNGVQARLIDVVALGGTANTPAVITFHGVLVVDRIIVSLGCPTQTGLIDPVTGKPIIYNALFDSITATPLSGSAISTLPLTQPDGTVVPVGLGPGLRVIAGQLGIAPYTTAVTPLTAFYTASTAGQSFALPQGWSVCTATLNGSQADYTVNAGQATFSLPVVPGDSVSFLCIR